MSPRWAGLVAIVCCLLAAACFDSQEPPGGIDSGPPPACQDADGDGYGAGEACPGEDCDDVDSTRHDGCVPCDGAQPEPCYDGPAGTENVGICRAGLRSCRGGVWTLCQGQVLPQDEQCDYEDDDCDGVIDDGVTSACGDCDADCRTACAGVDCEGELVAGAGGLHTAEGSVRATGGADLTPRLIWITSAPDDRVYEVATSTRETRGAYRIPSAPSSFAGDVAMDLRGNAFVVRYGAALVTRIDAADCLDRDGDGVVETSSGADDVLDDDECVRWSAEPDCGLDDCGAARSIALGDGGRVVWVGLQDPNLVVQLDAETGEPTGIDAEVFGQPSALLPSRDGLWVGTSAQLCAIAPDGSLDECRGAPDGMSMSRIDSDASGFVYGVPGLTRFDPVDDEFEPIASSGWSIAIEPSGDIWTLGVDGNDSTELTRYRPGAVDPESFVLADPAFAIAADLDGQLWTTSWRRGVAFVVDPFDGAEIATLFDGCDRAGGCLGQSNLFADPTAVRLRRVYPELLEHAEARAEFMAQCEDYEWSYWVRLGWQAADGGLSLEVRAAPSREELAAQRWLPLVSTEDAAGETAFPEEMETLRVPWLEVRARLRGPAAELLRLDVVWSCYSPDS